MKIGLITVAEYGLGGNLGDYIQNIAAMQFLPEIDERIDREQMPVCSGSEKVFVIMNGWFDFHSCNFPPSDHMVPLIKSIHLTGAAERYLEKNHQALDYFRAYQPIGCRDLQTLDFFSSHDVEAYFSGCLSLTLNREDFSEERHRQGVFLVDAFRLSALRRFTGPALSFPLRFHWSKVELLSHEMLHIGSLSRAFEFIKRSSHYRYKMRKAYRLLSLYANARLVITSRLHAALPCLAFGTPVLFVYSRPETYLKTWEVPSLLDDSRFSGLINDLNVIDDVRFFEGLQEGCWEINGERTLWNRIQNGTSYLGIRKTLREQTPRDIQRYLSR